MGAQLTGAATGAVVILAYILLLESLTAACVLLAHFIATQVRHLRATLAHKPNPAPVERPAYRVGGGLMKWE